jgi:hypothetical protein
MKMNDKNKNRSLITITILAFATVGCASAKIEATKDPTYTDKLHRIYVLIHQGSEAKSYAEGLSNSLSTALSENGIQFESRIISPLELDGDVYQDEINSYVPEAVLVIQMVGGTSMDGKLSRIVYDASLLTPDGKRRIWRAQVENTGGIYAGLIEKRMRKTAESILEQLKEDQLIESVEPTEID